MTWPRCPRSRPSPGATLPIAADGDTITVGGGQAQVVVPDIHTANATVHLIDSVMLPPAG